MATKRANRLMGLASTILGRDPAGDALPPQPGTDPASKRHFLALFIGTVAIMVVGVLVAFLEDDDTDEAAATPTIVVTPTAPGGE